MADLVEGQRHSLSSNPHNDTKTVVYLKLTDSALRAIEDYIKIKRQVTHCKPTIQFKGTSGVIEFPTKCADGDSRRSYQFSLAQCDPSCSSDCLQQDNYSDDSDSLELLGTMAHKITVCAGEDVYRNTKARMAKADEDNKKICTKEIKRGCKYRGKSVKKVIRPGAVMPPLEVSLVTGRTVSPSSALQRPPISSAPSHPVKQPSHIQSTPTAKAATSSSKPAFHSANLSSTSAFTSLSSSSSSSSSVPSQKAVSSLTKPGSNSGVITKPFKERVIHLLAVRPYKKPELIIRLHRDGIREKDKNTLGSCLQQVGVLNPRDNTFSLARHLYPDVNPDWPYYTDVDKLLLKKRMPVTPSQSPSVSPTDGGPHGTNHSSNVHPLDSITQPSIASNLPQSNSQKRSAGPDQANPVPTKKSKLSDRLAKYAYNNNKDGGVGSVSSGVCAQAEATTRSDLSTSRSLFAKQSIHDSRPKLAVPPNNTLHVRDTSAPAPAAPDPAPPAPNAAAAKRTADIRERDRARERERDGLTRDSTLKPSTHLTNGTSHGYTSSIKPRLPPSPVKPRLPPSPVKSRLPPSPVKSRLHPSPVKRQEVDSSVSRKENCPSAGNTSPRVEATTASSEYLLLYTAIRSLDQRHRYKQDFNAEYDEYKQLHRNILSVSKKFLQMEQDLKKAPEGSETRDNIESKIVSEYVSCKTDPKYLGQKDRFDHLHEKLAHIKKLILDYDQDAHT